MKVLISGIGGPTPRSIARRIRILFPNSVIVGIDSNPKALGFFMPGLVDDWIVVPRASDSGYWDAIHTVIQSAKIDLAFIQPEAEVIKWGEYHNKHGNYPCPVLIPDERLAINLVSKALMSDVLAGTAFIPKTIKISAGFSEYERIEKEVGYPCWIRASTGSGGYGSLKLQSRKDLESWLMVTKGISEYTISEFLPGRHMANQMLFLNGKYIKSAGLECAEYVMADIAPSKVTGNTSYGKFVNEKHLLDFCVDCLSFVADKLGVKLHGVFSFDLKEDVHGNLKVTEVNVRHMAYTGIMSSVGFDLVGDTIRFLLKGTDAVPETGHYFYDKDYVFLRDVDIEPIVVEAKRLSEVGLKKK